LMLLDDYLLNIWNHCSVTAGSHSQFKFLVDIAEMWDWFSWLLERHKLISADFASEGPVSQYEIPEGVVVSTSEAETMLTQAEFFCWWSNSRTRIILQVSQFRPLKCGLRWCRENEPVISS
jgi:hypothetical protein